jgi:hypothetical protein
MLPGRAAAPARQAAELPTDALDVAQHEAGVADDGDDLHQHGPGGLPQAAAPGGVDAGGHDAQDAL